MLREMVEKARNGKLLASQRAAAFSIATAANRDKTTIPTFSGDAPLVVSITTYPKRVGTAAKAIATILAQSWTPDVVLLVLSELEFPGRVLPEQFLPLVTRGVTVRWTPDNSRSYKKLIPALQQFPKSVIVTADDDVLYPRWWLERLMEAHRRRPGLILGHRGTVIGSTHDGALTPYKQWPGAKLADDPSRVFLTGVGGVLYPPGVLAKEVTDVELAQSLCPTADDIWFKTMSLLAGTGSAVVSDKCRDFPPVNWRGEGGASLQAVNVGQNRNDQQIATVSEHFGITFA